MHDRVHREAGKHAGGAKSDIEIAIDFLEKFRPNGPWVLTAIVPDKGTKTITALTMAAAKHFLQENSGKANVYFMVNPTRAALDKKAAKTDVAAIEFLFADLDPNDDERPEEAKARYAREITEFGLTPTLLIDSGNGLQVLWKLDKSILLAEPTGSGGKSKFSASDQAMVDEVEARGKNVIERLGSKAGTQNIDRILRMPGTINLPNKKKLSVGRVPCSTALLSSSSVTHSLSDFPLPVRAGLSSHKSSRPTGFRANTNSLPQSLLHILYLTGDQPAGYSSRSNLLWAFINQALKMGIDEEVIVQACLNDSYRSCSIREHVRENGNNESYVRRQIERAINEAGSKSVGEKVTIRVHPGETHLAWRETQNALLAANCPRSGTKAGDAAVAL
jgi:hypothetical protein